MVDGFGGLVEGAGEGWDCWEVDVRGEGAEVVLVVVPWYLEMR